MSNIFNEIYSGNTNVVVINEIIDYIDIFMGSKTWVNTNQEKKTMVKDSLIEHKKKIEKIKNKKKLNAYKIAAIILHFEKFPLQEEIEEMVLDILKENVNNNNNWETNSNFNTSAKPENHRAAQILMQNLKIKESRFYKKVMGDIRNVYRIGTNRLSDYQVIELIRKSNGMKSMSNSDAINFIFETYGIKIRNNNKGIKEGGYKPKKVNKTVTRIISGKKRVIHTGLRGGKYYISNKKKVYI